ncbi:hypothetical protein MKW94_003239 [Papaver nudicaule]|uniref:Magnesium transporter n=1 Tax=Papaver nudicaule TaxID=74823 RepID=A0AA41W1N6_PAPNU|nr:hypothetical protein [Papaver nudicaule]
MATDAAWPTWWCHVAAGHKYTDSWLHDAEWLHPNVSEALRDESLLINDEHLHYKVPVRVGGGMLFELLGISAGNPFVDEDDTPILLRSFTAQNFLVSFQELLATGGTNAPRTIHEVIAQLASCLSCWDDRLFCKSTIGIGEIERTFMRRRNHEDMNLFSAVLNQEIKKLSGHVTRIVWSLHAREAIIAELLQHLTGSAAARSLLEETRKNTREMIKEQEAVHGRVVAIQGLMQNSVGLWLQERRLRNLTLFGRCGLVVLMIISTILFVIDAAGDARYAFALFCGLLALLGNILIAAGSNNCWLTVSQHIPLNTRVSRDSLPASSKHVSSNLLSMDETIAEMESQLRRFP